MKTPYIITALIAVLLTSSCEKLFMEKVPGTTPNELFEQVWTFADQNYSFFEFKGIDWNTVKQTYAAKISDGMDEEALFDTLANMLYLLRDGHVNLTSDFNRSRNWQWFLDYPPNFDYTLLERNYFMDGQQYVGSFLVYDFGDVGYVFYDSFMGSVSNEDMDYVLEKFKDHKGLILDVRNNGGGSLFNVYTIANRFTDNEIDVAFERKKKGPGHEDFDEGTYLKLTPGDDSTAYTKPVVILTNRLCYSATNFMVTMMRELPNVTTIGDHTGGGGGIPTFTELSNGWVLRVSSSRLFTLDGFNVEGGIEPDIRVEQTDGDTNIGKDTILEFALNFLRIGIE
jgi:hypothetical protein